MILLFTSNAEDKYKRDALAALALPCGSVLRFRYDLKYVCPAFQKLHSRRDGTVRLSGSKEALFVYAQSDRTDRSKPLDFFPLRLGRVVRVQKVGLAYYADVQLRGYPDVEANGMKTIRKAIEKVPANYPLPATPETGLGLIWLEGSQQPEIREFPANPSETSGHSGHFFDRREAFPEVSAAREDSAGWQAVVSALGQSDLKDAAFFRVGGFFNVTRWWLRARRFVDSRIPPIPRWPEVEYAFPMGEHVVMTVEMLRPREGSPMAFELVIETGGDALAAVEPKKLLFESRYDQSRVVIASRRVLDAVMTTIGVTCHQVGQHPVPFAPVLAFIIRVRPSRGITLLAPLAAAAAALLLSMSPDFVAGVGELVKSQSKYPGVGMFLVTAKAELAVMAKAIAVALSVWAAWLVFRKAPVGK